MGKVKEGNKRLMITLPESLIDRLEDDTVRRGLDLSKSTRIQLALEKELLESELHATTDESKIRLPAKKKSHKDFG